MTNYRSGPITDHSGVVFDYNGLVLERVGYNCSKKGDGIPPQY